MFLFFPLRCQHVSTRSTPLSWLLHEHSPVWSGGSVVQCSEGRFTSTLLITSHLTEINKRWQWQQLLQTRLMIIMVTRMAVPIHGTSCSLSMCSTYHFVWTARTSVHWISPLHYTLYQLAMHWSFSPYISPSYQHKVGVLMLTCHFIVCRISANCYTKERAWRCWW